MAAPKKGTKAYELAQARRKENIIAKYGSYEAYLEDVRIRAAKGGKAKSPTKGFGSDKDRASKAGVKGGRISKRGPAVNSRSKSIVTGGVQQNETTGRKKIFSIFKR